jgi:hypothetical protein
MEEYVLIAQDRASAQTFLRQGDGTWSMMGVNGLDAMLRVRCLRIQIPLAEIYYRVALPDSPSVQDV